MAHLWSICIHVNFCFVICLPQKNLGPGSQPGLQANTQDSLNLQKGSRIGEQLHSAEPHCQHILTPDTL